MAMAGGRNEKPGFLFLCGFLVFPFQGATCRELDGNRMRASLGDRQLRTFHLGLARSMMMVMMRRMFPIRTVQAVNPSCWTLEVVVVDKAAFRGWNQLDLGISRLTIPGLQQLVCM